MEALKSTLLHTLELVVSLGAAYLILSYFQADSETTTAVLGIVLASLAKFARASDSSFPDYVNK